MRAYEKLIAVSAALAAVGGAAAAVLGYADVAVAIGLAVSTAVLFILVQVLRQTRKLSRGSELLAESTRMTRHQAQQHEAAAVQFRAHVTDRLSKLSKLSRDGQETMIATHRVAAEIERSLERSSLEMAAFSNEARKYREEADAQAADALQFRADMREQHGDLLQHCREAHEGQTAARLEQLWILEEVRSLADGLPAVFGEHRESLAETARVISTEISAAAEIRDRRRLAQIESLRRLLERVDEALGDVQHRSIMFNERVEGLEPVWRQVASADAVDALRTDIRAAASRSVLEAAETRKIQGGIASVNAQIRGLKSSLAPRLPAMSIDDAAAVHCQPDHEHGADTGVWPASDGGGSAAPSATNAGDARRSTSDVNKLITAMRSETQQVEALLQLYKGFEPRWAMPSLGRWALDARAALHLRSLVEEYRPQRILEIGGGSSTIWLGYMCERLGVELISVDHHQTFYERTRLMVSRHRLTHVVDVRLGPLTQYRLDSGVYDWYDSSAFSGVQDIDMVLVDGPPATTGPLARFPALPVLADRLAPQALILLDDSERADEAEAVERWTSRYGLSRIDEGVSRLAVLRAASTSSSNGLPDSEPSPS